MFRGAEAECAAPLPRGPEGAGLFLLTLALQYPALWLGGRVERSIRRALRRAIRAITRWLRRGRAASSPELASSFETAMLQFKQERAFSRTLHIRDVAQARVLADQAANLARLTEYHLGEMSKLRSQGAYRRPV